MWCGEGRSLWLLSDSAGKLFYSTDAEVLGDDEVVELDLALRILYLQEGSGMSHIDEALRQPKLDLSGELEQAGELVGGSGAEAREPEGDAVGAAERRLRIYQETGE